MNLILCGFMGCGKTTVGKLVAQKGGFAFADTDEILEKEQGMPVSRIFETAGEAYFRGLEHVVCSRLGQADQTVVSTGGGALTFNHNVQAFKKNGIIIFLDVPFEILKQRVGAGETRPLFRDAERAKSLFEERVPLYRAASDVVVDGNCPPEKVASFILDFIHNYK